MPDAAHGHAGCGCSGFGAEFSEHVFKVFFNRHGTGAQYIANVTVNFSFDDSVQHFSLSSSELKGQAHGLNHSFVRDLLHDDEPVIVSGFLMEPESQPFGAFLNTQPGGSMCCSAVAK